MTVSDTFAKVAAEFGGEYFREDNIYSGEFGSDLHSSTYQIIFEHKGYEVNITNELGHQNLGKVACFLPLQSSSMEFEIVSDGPWKQFFKRKKPPITTHTKNTRLEQILTNGRAFQDLSEIVRTQRFEPIINGKNTTNHFLISADYHLLFDNKQAAVQPLCSYFCRLIDFFDAQTPPENRN